MSVTPTFQGEVQLRRWSESSTQGVQVTFALAESADLDKFKGLDGKRFMAVLVQIGDDEQPVAGNPVTTDIGNPTSGNAGKPHIQREPLGDLCWRAVQWCKEPEFWKFLNNAFSCDEVTNEAEAADLVKFLCCVNSRRELDTDPECARQFNHLIRGPYQKHLIARGIVR